MLGGVEVMRIISFRDTVIITLLFQDVLQLLARVLTQAPPLNRKTSVRYALRLHVCKYMYCYYYRSLIVRLLDVARDKKKVFIKSAKIQFSLRHIGGGELYDADGYFEKDINILFRGWGCSIAAPSPHPHQAAPPQ